MQDLQLQVGEISAVSHTVACCYTKANAR